LSGMPGNSRRSSMAAANSPPCLKAERIASASVSETTNIPRAWRGDLGAARKKDVVLLVHNVRRAPTLSPWPANGVTVSERETRLAPVPDRATPASASPVSG
jgi:hypothetical protein